MKAALFFPFAFIQHLLAPVPFPYSSPDWVARGVYTRDLFNLALSRGMHIVIYFLGSLRGDMAQYFRRGLDLKYEDMPGGSFYFVVYPTFGGLLDFIRQERIELRHSVFIGEEGIESTPIIELEFHSIYLVGQGSINPALRQVNQQLGGPGGPAELDMRRLKCVTDFLEQGGMLNDAQWINLNLLEIALWGARDRNRLLDSLCKYFGLQG